MASSEDVLLGYVGRTLGHQELDVRISRFGGTPVWSKEPPPESAIRRPDYFTCRLCGKPLVLFTQISAGYGDRPMRLLHVFSCRSNKCSSDPLSWRVLRSTGKLAEEVEEDNGNCQSPPSQGAGYPISATDVPADDWGVALAADDWSTPGASTTSADDEIEALLALRSAAVPAIKASEAAANAKKPCADAQDADAWQGVPAELGREEPLPSLAITIDYEPWAPIETTGEHEQELLQRYLQSDLAEGEVDQMLATGGLPRELLAEVESLRLQAQQDGYNDSEADSHTGEAGFEEEDVDDDDVEEAILSGGGSAINWLRRFQQRLARSPQQVIRYCWGGDPLWLHAPPTSKPPKCTCGASRCFELQLLPTLHAQLAAAVPSAESISLGMEWGSVVIFTCSKDCPCEEPREEFVVVQPPL